MIALANLNHQQKTVVGSAIVAVIFSTILVLIAYFFIPWSLPILNTPEQRLIFTLRCQIFPALMLFAGIFTVSINRFSSAAINPLANAESALMRVHLRYLRNTLEQFVLFFIASLVLSTFLDSHSIKLIPILAGVFVLGRIGFWLGYLHDPMDRGLGMAVTLYPTVAILFYDAYRILGG